MIEKLKYEIKVVRSCLFQMQNACIDLAKQLEETKKKLEIAKKQRNKFIDKFFSCDPNPGFSLTGNQSIYDQYDKELGEL